MSTLHDRTACVNGDYHVRLAQPGIDLDDPAFDCDAETIARPNRFPARETESRFPESVLDWGIESCTHTPAYDWEVRLLEPDGGQNRALELKVHTYYYAVDDDEVDVQLCYVREYALLDATGEDIRRATRPEMDVPAFTMVLDSLMETLVAQRMDFDYGDRLVIRAGLDDADQGV